MARNAQVWKATSANHKIRKLLFTLATSNFQELFVIKFDEKLIWFEEISFIRNLWPKNRYGSVEYDNPCKIRLNKISCQETYIQ